MKFFNKRGGAALVAVAAVGGSLGAAEVTTSRPAAATDTACTQGVSVASGLVGDRRWFYHSGYNMDHSYNPNGVRDPYLEWSVRWSHPSSAPGTATLCLRNNRATGRKALSRTYWSSHDRDGGWIASGKSGGYAVNAPAGSGWRVQSSTTVMPMTGVTFSMRIVQANGRGSDTFLCLKAFAISRVKVNACPLTGSIDWPPGQH